MYFEEGMKWDIKYYHCMPDEEDEIKQITADESVATEEGNLVRLNGCNIYPDIDTILVLVRDGKVYFQYPEGDDGQWYLLYDFTLSPGEGCYIYSPKRREDNVPYATYIKCVGIQERNPEYDNWDTMEIEVAYFTNIGDLFEKGIWIRGLCSELGLFANMEFGWDGGGTNLWEAWLGEECIYKSRYASLPSAEANKDTLNVITEGLDVEVKGVNAGEEAVIYSMKGGRFNPTGSPSHFTLPNPGFYILKAGNKTKKITVKD